MKEELVSQETYYKATQKGFDYKNCTCGGFPDCVCNDFRPTQSLLHKWVRDVHNFVIGIEANYDDDCFEYIIESHPKRPFAFAYGQEKYMFESYEEALESGLRKALELI